MNVSSDCVYEILRRAGPLNMAACAVVCKWWKRVIFRTRLPIVVFSQAGVKYNDIDGCTRFTAFVRNRRGYVRCVIRIPLEFLDISDVYAVSRGGSREIELVSKDNALDEQIGGVYGDYKVFEDCVSEVKAIWPCYDELAAVLGAVIEFLGAAAEPPS